MLRTSNLSRTRLLAELLQPQFTIPCVSAAEHAVPRDALELAAAELEREADARRTGSLMPSDRTGDQLPLAARRAEEYELEAEP